MCLVGRNEQDRTRCVSGLCQRLGKARRRVRQRYRLLPLPRLNYSWGNNYGSQTVSGSTQCSHGGDGELLIPHDNGDQFVLKRICIIPRSQRCVVRGVDGRRLFVNGSRQIKAGVLVNIPPAIDVCRKGYRDVENPADRRRCPSDCAMPLSR